MKKLFVCMLMWVLCLSFTVSGAYAEGNEYKVIVKTGTVEFKSEKPVELNGTIYVPARPIFEKLGHKVSWDKVKKAVLVKTKKGKTMTIYVEKSIVQLHSKDYDKEIKYSPSPRFIKGHLYVPKEIFNALGSKVSLDGKVLSILCPKCKTNKSVAPTKSPSNSPVKSPTQKQK